MADYDFYINAPISFPKCTSIFGQRLKYLTEELYKRIIKEKALEELKNPELIKTLQFLLILIRIAEEGYLTKEEENLTINKIKEIEYKLDNTFFNYRETSTLLEKIITNIKEINAKSKIIALLTELEYILCAIKEEFFLSKEDYKILTQPFKKYLKEGDTFQITFLAKELEKTKGKKSANLILETLKKLSKEI